MTLKDHYALCFKTYATAFRAHHKNLNEDRPISDEDVAQSVFTLVSGNIRFMLILRGFLRDEASSDSVVIENVDFQGFRTFFGTLGNEADIII